MPTRNEKARRDKDRLEDLCSSNAKKNLARASAVRIGPKTHSKSHRQILERSFESLRSREKCDAHSIDSRVEETHLLAGEEKKASAESVFDAESYKYTVDLLSTNHSNYCICCEAAVTMAKRAEKPPPSRRQMLRISSARIFQSFRISNNRNKKKDESKKAATKLQTGSKIQAASMPASHAEYSGPFCDEREESSKIVATRALPEVEQPSRDEETKRRARAPPGGALRRLERRMSMESVTSLNSRREQQEQRLLNQSIGGDPTIPKPSVPNQQPDAADSTDQPKRMSLNQQNSLTDLLVEYEQSFL